MTDQHQLRSHLNVAIVALCTIFAFLLIDGLWHIRHWWEIFGAIIPAGAFLFLGVANLIQAKQKLFEIET